VKKSPDPVDLHVGQRLRLRRMQLNMTQDQLARQLGLAFQQIQKYEAAENRLSAGRLFRIAQILDVPVGYFFDEAAPDRQGGPRDAALLAHLSSAEGADLNRAFRNIPNAQIRRSLLALVRTLGGEG
jgi:transcriptional regulator with XRE-family HTH domain